jgi:hypothetical protein
MKRFGFSGWAGAVAALLVVASAQAQPAQKTNNPKDTKTGPDAPRLKPSKYSKTPIDITTNEYGAFKLAPKAPGIGAVIPDFELPDETGATFSLKKALHDGPLVLVFYRGDW